MPCWKREKHLQSTNFSASKRLGFRVAKNMGGVGLDSEAKLQGLVTWAAWQDFRFPNWREKSPEIFFGKTQEPKSWQIGRSKVFLHLGQHWLRVILDQIVVGSRRPNFDFFGKLLHGPSWQFFCSFLTLRLY